MKNSPATPLLPSAFVLGLLAACNGGGDCNDIVSLPPPPGTGDFGNFDFALRQDVNLGGKQLTGTVFEDLNDDGLVDIAELSSLTGRLHIGRGLSDGTWLDIAVLPTPAQPFSLESGDFNGDGRVDLAVGCLPTSPAPGANGQLALYFQDEFGDFALVDTTPMIGTPLSLERLELGGGDFDANGRDDLLVAQAGAQVVQRLRWEGVWSLMSTLDSEAAGFSEAMPLTLATLDMDGDGDDDVVLGENTDPGQQDRVVAFENDGFGGFMPAVLVLPGLQSPIVESQGDIDGDGFEDLSVAQLNANALVLLHGSVDGLMDITTTSFGGSLTGSVWTDLDGDGILDVAAARVHDQAIGVRYGLPEDPILGLQFGPADFYNVGFSPHDLTLVSLPDDTLPDLACANTGDVSMLRNRGNRTFYAASGFEVGMDPQRVIPIDLDGSGTVDVISIDRFQSKLIVMDGQGDGTFVKASEVPLSTTSVETPGHLVVRDFDEDGRYDILVSVFDQGELRLLRNPGSLSFVPPALSDVTTVGSNPLGIDSADYNGDGHWDVLLANSGDQNVQVLLGAGDGTFSALTPVPLGGDTLAVYSGDLDGDGYADGVVTMYDADMTNPRVKLLQGDGTGALVDVGTFALSAPSPTIQVEDLNDDGSVDMVFGQSTVFTDEVRILMNDGGFGFTASSLTVGADPGSLSIADIDEDGDMDLVCPIGTGELRIALGDGTGAFPEVVPLEGSEFTLPVPFGTNASAFADINGDGLADLLMSSHYTQFLWVSLNQGGSPSN